jgi:UDP:flavonoid glycosyltransferase YjiC (YdhE family)
MRQRRFLLVIWDGGGNAVPYLSIASQLVRRGHLVRVLTHASLRERTLDAGAEYAGFDRGPAHDPRSPETDAVRVWEGRNSLEVGNLVRERMLFGPALAIARDTLDQIRDLRAEVVAVDYVVFGAHLAAEAAGVPLATLVPHIYPLPHAASAGRSPFTALFDRLISRGLEPLNRARSELSLPSLAAVKDQYNRSQRMLLTTYRCFDEPSGDLPANVRYVGSQLHFPEKPASPPSRPHVLLSFSTAHQNQSGLVLRLAALFDSAGIAQTILTGPALDRQRLDFPASATVLPFMSHERILPNVSCLITHAGHGSALGALVHGVPQLCFPFTQDQFDIARIVARNGCGIELSKDAKDDTILAALRRLIDDVGFRKNVNLMRDRIAAEHHPELAVTELETLASPTRSTAKSA